MKFLKFLLLLIIIFIFGIFIYFILNEPEEKKQFIKKHIFIENLKLSEKYVELKIGDIIEFQNNDSVRHTIICDSPYVKK